MPSIQKKTVKNHDYWYLIESYRDSKGVVKTRTLEYYGNTANLIAHFNDMLKRNTNSRITLKSYEHGSVFALAKLADKIGVFKILAEVFPQKSRKGFDRPLAIIAGAIHRVCSPASKRAFGEWVEGTTLAKQFSAASLKEMSSQVFWDFMDGIAQNKLDEAADAIARRIIDLYQPSTDCLALDYTNFYTFIASQNKRSTLTARGHNKQKRNDCRQFSLALVSTHAPVFPLFAYTYEGSINDVTVFPVYYNHLVSRLPLSMNEKDITFVFDGGSVSKDNLAMIKGHYLCAFSLHSCKQLYDIDLDEYSTVQWKKEKDVLCYRLRANIWGVDRECVLTYSDALFTGQASEFDKDMDAIYGKAGKVNERLANKRSRIKRTMEGVMEALGIQSKYLALLEVRFDGNRVSVTVNQEKADAYKRKYFGKKLVITDRRDLSTAEIIRIYREQDDVETVFALSKDHAHCAFRPQFHYTDDKIRVHVFICLLGLMLAVSLRHELAMQGIHVSVDEMMRTLSSIREAVVTSNMPTTSGSNKVETVIEDMDDKQKIIWEAINKI